MKKLKWLFATLALLLLSSCNPLEVTHTIKCVKHNCTVVVTNHEYSDVELNINVTYETQGTRIVPNYKPLYKDPLIFDHWARGMQPAFSANKEIVPGGKSKTYTIEIPETLAGTTLVEAFIFVEAPNGLSTAYGKYSVFDVISTTGTVESPITYKLDCSGDRVKITVINDGTLGDKTIALYTNGNLKDSWQQFYSKSNQTLTFTSDPITDGIYLIEADVNGHQEQAEYLNYFDYHGGRTYCVPTK